MLLKALEKDRTRRYETANGLARDIERYLADEVVEARPPTSGYRLRKFVRRHKGQVIAASLVLLALLVGIGGTTFGLVRAKRQQQRAEAGERLADERLVQVEAEKKKAEDEKQVAQAVRDFLQNKLLGQADTRNQANALLKAGGSPSEAKLIPRSANCSIARCSNWPRNASRRISPSSRFYSPSCSRRLAIPIVAWENTTGR